MPVRGGDYEYEESYYDHQQKRERRRKSRFSYVLVDTGWRDTPILTIRREGILDKFAASFGFDDIDFESEEFSRRYHVGCSDRKFAYDVITPRAMEFLIREAAPAMRIEQGCVLICNSRAWKPERFRHAVFVSRGFLRTWPEHARARIESRSAEPVATP